MPDLLQSRKFWSLVLGTAAIVKIPPFDTIGAPLQAKIVGALLVAFILATGLEKGLEMFGSGATQPKK